MTIDTIKALCADKDNIHMTSHVSDQCRERNIKGKDIINAVFNGEIIEDYPNDYPFPSALIFGHDTHNKILHVVAGIGNNKLWIITAYYPDDGWWEDGFKTRKAAK